MLEIDGLTIEYGTDDGRLTAVDRIDLDVRSNEVVCIVGESGCGKTTVCKGILGLLPENGRITRGAIRYDGTDLTGLTQKEYNRLRWTDISYVIQNAMNALDPVKRIGNQFVEVIRVHSDVSKADARERARTLLDKVGIDGARARDYPHEFSGGQRQRLVIALALALEPPIVLADEPTTGLDVVVQDEILELLTGLQDELEMTLVVITHDMSVVSEIADRVVVMYGGRIVEVGTLREIFNESAHPYTMGLINAFPSLSVDQDELVSIPGAPPDLVDPPAGCRFEDRCPFATAECRQPPPMNPVGDGHSARCHYTDSAATHRRRSLRAETWEVDAGR